MQEPQGESDTALLARAPRALGGRDKRHPSTRLTINAQEAKPSVSEDSPPAGEAPLTFKLRGSHLNSDTQPRARGLL